MNFDPEVVSSGQHMIWKLSTPTCPTLVPENVLERTQEAEYIEGKNVGRQDT
jgi:hypothetical protein